MIQILIALVLISSPSHVNVGEEFNASVIVENATDLSAFQLDISYENLDLIGIERGEAIKNWSVFDYKIFDSNVRVIAAKFRENPIENGEILNLRFKSKGNAKIDINGILSNSNGERIETEFRAKEIFTPTIIKTTILTPEISENKKPMTFLEKYWFALLPILILAAIIWKLKNSF